MGGTNNSYTAFRPFGSVVLDGVDLDLEEAPTPQTNWLAWGAFVTSLRALMATDRSKTYLISAAPVNPIFSASWNQQQFGTVPQASAATRRRCRRHKCAAQVACTSLASSPPPPYSVRVHASLLSDVNRRSPVCLGQSCR